MPMMNPYANLVRKLDVAGVTFNFPPCLLSERPYILEMHSGLSRTWVCASWLYFRRFA